MTEPIVIDSGTGSVKSGLASEESPSFILPSFIGGKSITIDKTPALSFISESPNPFIQGVVSDWEGAERLWGISLAKKQIRNPSVLITEQIETSTKDREKTAEILFEKFGVSKALIVPDSVLALYGKNQTTGLVVDIGAGISQAIPIVDGYYIGSGKIAHYGGINVLALMTRLMVREGLGLAQSGSFTIMEAIKRKLTRIAPITQVKDPVMLRLSKTTEVSLEISPYTASEGLFDPKLFGSEDPSITDLVISAITGAEPELRERLWGNIWLTGGVSKTEGIARRLFEELQTKVTNMKLDVQVKLQAGEIEGRDIDVWRGGAMLAISESYEKHAIKAEEWKEDRKVIHRGI